MQVTELMLKIKNPPYNRNELIALISDLLLSHNLDVEIINIDSYQIPEQNNEKSI